MMNMKNIDDTRLLIISNNVLSKTNNNGKTLLSFIEGIDKNQIRQLYFNGQKPTVAGYSYYQLSDGDVIKGMFSKSKRGRVWDDVTDNSSADQKTESSTSQNKNIKKTTFMRFLRDVLWMGRWKSKQLFKWLDEFQPDTVFFVAGDSGFSYNIVKKIVNKYHTRLVTYITDDYIMPRKKESLLGRIRRLSIRRKMVSCIRESDGYFTISDLMKKTYASITGKDSDMIMNMTPSLYDSTYEQHSNEEIVMVYTGSLYYGRDEILGKIADAALRYNQSDLSQKKIRIRVYSNNAPSDVTKARFERKNCCEHCGSLSFDELKVVLNCADVLLFVESFDADMMEKTKYSLSTKVPEYLSVGKPIFAVGPSEIGSMDYLSDVAFCANSKDDVFEVLISMLSSCDLQKKLVEAGLIKYNTNHNTRKQKQLFAEKCFGVKKEEDGCNGNDQ